jgi:hypothetical protein
MARSSFIRIADSRRKDATAIPFPNAVRMKRRLRSGVASIHVAIAATFLGGIFLGLLCVFGIPQLNFGGSMTEAQRVQMLEDEIRRMQLEQDVAGLQDQMVALKAGKQTGSSSKTLRSASKSSSSLTSSTSQASRTLAYWNQMNAIIGKESRMRLVPSGGLTQFNAAGFLNARLKAYEFASKNISGLSTSGVDPIAIEVASSVADWYERGVEVTRQAKKLMSSSSGLRKGGLGVGWSNEEKAHNQSVNQVNSAGESARQRLIRKHGIKFPPLK